MGQTTAIRMQVVEKPRVKKVDLRGEVIVNSRRRVNSVLGTVLRGESARLVVLITRIDHSASESRRRRRVSSVLSAPPTPSRMRGTGMDQG